MKKICLSFLITILIATSGFSQISPSWLRYCAISPTGEKIAFVYKGDIYTVNSSGGEANLLTRNTGMDFMPVWSPDGKKIAYASDRHGSYDIFIMPATGGTPERLTYYSGEELPWSFTPDGSQILFTSNIQDFHSAVSFPISTLSELYSVPAKGGRIKQILSTPAEYAFYSKDMKRIYYQDRTGTENIWRKHHQSSVTRNIRYYDVQTGKHFKITDFEGEDRNPVLSGDNKTLFYLSEQANNNLNINKINIEADKFSKPETLTKFEKHPMRFLSVSENNKLCFSYNGQIYVKELNSEPKKLDIIINEDLYEIENIFVSASSGGEGEAVSPDGKEVAFLVRGNVFVTSVEYATTRQITFTPGPERSVSFSKDGKTLIYASEREGSWGIYKTTIDSPKDKHFVYAEKIKEEVILNTEKDEFQPSFSPDNKEVAFLESRVMLKVFDLDSKKTRTILDGKYNYSYSDGDQHYRWSPDGEYFLISFTPNTWLISDIGLIKSDGKSPIINLTQSGYGDGGPEWILKGKGIMWTTDRNGYRSHGSWGAFQDVYAMFLTKDAYDEFTLSEEELALKKEMDKDAEDEKNKDKEKEDADKKEEDKKEKPVEKIKIELEGIENRKVRLTANSSGISGTALSPDGEKLYYLTSFESGFDLWVNNLRKKETKLVLKLSGGGGNLILDEKGENLFLFSSGINKISTSDYSKKDISYKAEYYLNANKEREALFDHAWRQMKEKFYKPDFHGVDWEFYGKEYRKFLPHINNNIDFSVLLSELLGEVNASHTGSYYGQYYPGGDNTASLGILWDWNYTGDGIKIAELLTNTPIYLLKDKIKPGMIIEAIDGNTLKKEQDFFQYLNRKAGKKVIISFLDTEKNNRFSENIELISRGTHSELLYKRWIKQMEKLTEELSEGQIAYVHVRGMDGGSFTEVYSDVLGKNHEKKAIVIDTRFNGGGWLHDDLATFFSGKKYVTWNPGGKGNFGHDPYNKWTKPSALLVSEGNYSDAHGFPYVYQTLKIGQIIGMPVPGTMTAVWWETMQNGVIFGIPQVGAIDLNGNYLENKQLTPEHIIENDFDILVKGSDQQLAKAVDILLKN